MNFSLWIYSKYSPKIQEKEEIAQFLFQVSRHAASGSQDVERECSHGYKICLMPMPIGIIKHLINIQFQCNMDIANIIRDSN
jgi:hypothetical protein